ncbi:MAG TPA: hypothetical protein VN455_03660 [Methanotrichaceae archaeon]|nr:hypothetical protein [Methanotrichaceae archaeon]
MSTSVDEAIIQKGAVGPESFHQGCTPGSWVDFWVNFPERFDDDLPRIIITPNNLDTGDTYNPAVVGLVRDVSPSGFYISARSSDCTGGLAGFSWMAVLETPGRKKIKQMGMMGGVLEPKQFMPSCINGDWRSWPVAFDDPLSSETPMVFTSANDIGSTQYTAAAVGMAQNLSPKGFTLAARNSDCMPGDCSFCWLALSREARHSFSLIDSGWTDFRRFERTCISGDWQSWKITFHQLFPRPPLIFLTGYGGRSSDELVHFPRIAAVGIAKDVTENGFQLAARNQDCMEGYAGFYWLAVGQ